MNISELVDSLLEDHTDSFYGDDSALVSGLQHDVEKDYETMGKSVSNSLKSSNIEWRTDWSESLDSLYLHIFSDEFEVVVNSVSEKLMVSSRDFENFGVRSFRDDDIDGAVKHIVHLFLANGAPDSSR